MKKAYDTKSVARNIISEGAEEIYKICDAT